MRLVGPDGAGDEARLVRRLLGPVVGGRARELRRRDVHLVGELLHAVVGHGDALRVERVGLDDVGAGLEIGLVDLAR